MIESEAGPQVATAGSKASGTFWLIGLGLVGYVALCSGHRDRFPDADAWEHHRVVVALTQDLWKPGNPTYATPEPSIRYSPYMVCLASICRLTGINPYNALTGAAVVNTALLVVGLRLLLGRFGEAGAGTLALLTMISLWGGAPGYANSYSLADLPWHQVNPSAFSFALTLIIWSLFSGTGAGWQRWVEIAASITLATLAVLDHPMTGVFALVGLLIFAVDDRVRRIQQLLLAGLIGVVVIGLCLVWPWYSFRAALTWTGDRDYWFNPYILQTALSEWCAPGLALLLVALPLRGRPLVHVCLVGVAVVAFLIVLAYVTRSPTFARMILPGMIFVHLPIAIFLADSEILSIRTWPARLRALTDRRTGPQAVAGFQCLVAALLVYFVIPQVINIVRLPHLGRPWFDQIRGRVASSPSPRPALERVLDPVQLGETVLSDPFTSWQIPSTSRGRVIAALHYELFVPNQKERREDLERFFQGSDTAERCNLVKKYAARWILINTKEPGYSSDNLVDDAAVVRKDGPYILMDAGRWLADAGRLTP